MNGPNVTRLVEGLKAERQAREARLKDLVSEILAKPAPEAPAASDPSAPLREEIARLRGEKEELERRLRERPLQDPGVLEALRSEAARLRGEKEDLVRKNTSLYEELQGKQALEEKLVGLTRSLDMEHRALEEAQVQAGNLERQLMDGREALAREQSLVQRLREQIGEVQDQVEPLKRKLRESEIRMASPPPTPALPPLEARLLEVVQQVQSARKGWLDAVLKDLARR